MHFLQFLASPPLVKTHPGATHIKHKHTHTHAQTHTHTHPHPQTHAHTRTPHAFAILNRAFHIYGDHKEKSTEREK